MRPTVIIPNRYPEIIQPLIESIHEFEPSAKVLIVGDNHKEGYGFDVIEYKNDSFQYAEAVNLGIRTAGNSNVFLLNDDCVLLMPTFSALEDIAYQYLNVGILSPIIKGCVGNPTQRYWETSKYWRTHEKVKFVWDPVPICFPCVYVKSYMISQIGYLDDSIKGYGFEDNEYSSRARRFGWETAVTSRVTVQHGDGSRALGEGRGKSWSVSFARKDNELNRR